VLDALKDKEKFVRNAAALTLGRVAQVESPAREQAFKLLSDYDQLSQRGMQTSLCGLLVTLAEHEERENRDPVQFLFDHLEGRRSLVVGDNANTFASYRSVIIRSLAQWVVSEKPEAKETRESLRHELEQMRRYDNRIHLSIAAWDALAEISRLYEQRP
jgi:hypothetical protein